MKTLFCAIMAVCILTGLWAEDLSLRPEDILIEQSLEGGYNLWVRHLPGQGSVLLTESTEDPERRTASYAFRNPVYHPANGDEKRILDGVFLEQSGQGYFIIDSTPEPHPTLGSAFRLFIPYVVDYGYSWSRQGELQVLDGAYLNVRTFEKPYGDYTGAFHDNPFILRVVQKPMEGPPEGNFMPDTVESFTEIADKGKGEVVFSSGEEDILLRLRGILAPRTGKTLDLVLALDTTQSMENDIPYLEEHLITLLTEATAGYEKFRFGMVFYKDYMEEYLTRVVPFQPTLDNAVKALGSLKVIGGRDIPEAVYEALYDGLREFPWDAEDRLLILLGDAPPHPRPRGRITKEMVYDLAESRGVEIHAIILPQ
ncbi:MAG: VWA domain-containing protein [Spirochaetales bacterium]|nr:VWA domain-containing protein [Spirochaetales bacterium]